jgi:hypothetical protein
MNAEGVVNGMCFVQQSRKGVHKMRHSGWSAWQDCCSAQQLCCSGFGAHFLHRVCMFEVFSYETALLQLGSYIGVSF